MRIRDIKVRVFNYRSNVVRDEEGHTHPGEEHDARSALLTITADDGSEGHCFGPVRPQVIEEYVQPMVVGEDPYDREKIWQHMAHNQRGSGGAVNDRVLATVEMALWDLAGRKLKLPVYKLLGGYRDRVPAYGSTMCGDELRGGLATPDDYGRFAEWLVKRGYPAIKLHTWMPPVSFAPDPRMDVKACAAVREAAGPDIALMIDSYHGYSREECYYLGRELEKLDFYWFEEPMDEHKVSSYVWLAEQLSIPVLGPESAEGKMHTRAEWIVRKASDMTRAGVMDVGGIGPTMKIAHLAESHGVACEIHSPGAANLHVLGAMGIPGKFYERGLLHPFIDYEAPPPWLNSLDDPMDEDGFVPVPQGHGLGEDINFDYINDNLARGG
jgi:L-alanine-DL-glutamate epimerase-like enolase superfamily enzyme